MLLVLKSVSLAGVSRSLVLDVIIINVKNNKYPVLII